LRNAQCVAGAGLPIFVFVSQAPEHREELPLAQIRPPGQSVYHRKRDSTGAGLAIDGLGIALHTLRHGLVTDEGVRWSPRSWTRSLRAVNNAE
jgi:hypothetical protein